MKTYKIILIALAILSANNLILLSFIGYFSEAELNTHGTRPKQLQTNDKPASTSSKVAETFGLETNTSTHQNQKSQITETIEDYVRSEDFSNVLSDWQADARVRYAQMKERLDQMSAAELHSLMLSSESRTEKSYAMNMLLEHGKFKTLSNDEILNLHINARESGLWNSGLPLETLLEREEPQALELAKQLISDGASPTQYDSDQFFAAIYDKDPDFIKALVVQTEFNEDAPPYGLMQFISSDAELSKTFFENNLDKVLNSQNTSILNMPINVGKLEINQQQEYKIIDLLNSKSSRQNNLAIRLATKLDNQQVLRDAFNKLDKERSQTEFTISMLRDNPDKRTIALAKEFAENIDSPEVRYYLQIYGDN